MLPASLPRPAVLLAICVLAVAFVGLVQPSVTALPGVSDQTGPTNASVTGFERLESGCADDIATYGGGSISGGELTKTSFVETGGPNASLSASVERTSPHGADLSSFRVHVDSHGAEESNASCEYGVQYRITVTTSGGAPAGIFSDAHGTRVLWLENGEYTGCSSSVTSPIDDECHRFADPPERTWANATS
ncbi:hypothetical protein [Halorientalis halophila]|uniref:hypothetical protein n=1 Tax=Halorientalis halophila TaxID=3108499 RepID=UPI003007F550